MAWQGKARRGQAWQGKARALRCMVAVPQIVKAGRGQAWQGLARHGTARQGKGHSVGVLRIVSAAGECYGGARPGDAGQGTAWHGMARHGKARVLRHMVAVPQIVKARRG